MPGPSSRGDRPTIIGIIPQYPKHSQNNIYGKVKMPPVGIISVLSQLAEPKLRVYGIDENNYAGPLDISGMPDHGFLQNSQPAKIAMFYGGMSNSIPRLYSLAQQYKRFGAITIAGGSHVDALPEEALNSGVDIVVRGEGEETAIEILEALQGCGYQIMPEKLAGINGISFLSDGKVIHTAGRAPLTDLDTLKDPDITIIKYLKKKWKTIPINKGRGCNFRCEFCVVNTQYGKHKSCSTEKAFNQLVRYADLGKKKFFFTDDNFAQDPKEAIALCKLIGDYKRRFRKKIDIIVQVRSEVAHNNELIDAMRYAGVTTLAIGFESPLDEELAAMNKGVTVAKLAHRSRKLSEHFYIHGMFIFGYPLKTSISVPLRERARAFERFFKRARIDTIQILNAVPLPGSDLRNRLQAEGRLLPPEIIGWDKYDGQFLCYEPEAGLDPYELQKLPRLLMRKRYLGNFFARKINYGNWAQWVYYATLGFPLQFSFFYMKRFIWNMGQRQRARIVHSQSLLPRRNIFHETLVTAWHDIKRKWRNLTVKTYGGAIARRWFRQYKDSDHSRLLKRLAKA
ncbi:MAG: radical SAM protein [archaeon]